MIAGNRPDRHIRIVTKLRAVFYNLSIDRVNHPQGRRDLHAVARLGAGHLPAVAASAKIGPRLTRHADGVRLLAQVRPQPQGFTAQIQHLKQTIFISGEDHPRPISFRFLTQVPKNRRAGRIQNDHPWPLLAALQILCIHCAIFDEPDMVTAVQPMLRDPHHRFQALHWRMHRQHKASKHQQADRQGSQCQAKIQGHIAHGDLGLLGWAIQDRAERETERRLAQFELVIGLVFGVLDIGDIDHPHAAGLVGHKNVIMEIG